MRPCNNYRIPTENYSSWLGAKRYEAYKAGNLAEKAIFAPDLAFRVPAEDLRLDGKTLRQAVMNSEIQEHFKREELEENLKKRESAEMLDGFEEQKTTRKAEKYIKEKLKINADYSRLPIEVANDMNQELVRAFNMFGTVGIIENVKVDDKYLKDNKLASYDPNTFSILLRSDYGKGNILLAIKKASKGFYSSQSGYHAYRHEIGHALLQYFKRDAPERIKLTEELFRGYFRRSSKGIELLSEYASTNYREMVAEAFAEIMEGSPREFAKKVLSTLTGGTYNDK